MADLIKKIKIKKQDGTFTDYIPIGAEAQNVSTSDGDSVQLKLNKKPYYYNSVTDMKADTKLKAGDMAVTLGYYEANDGGGAEYRIVSGTHTDDGGSYHELSNSLFAELIIEKDLINIKWFGAYGDNSHNDTDSIQNAINFTEEKKIYFPKGNYIIRGAIDCNNKRISIVGDGEGYGQTVCYIKQETDVFINISSSSIIEKIYFSGSKDCYIKSICKGNLQNLRLFKVKVWGAQSVVTHSVNSFAGYIYLDGCNFRYCNKVLYLNDNQSLTYTYFNFCIFTDSDLLVDCYKGEEIVFNSCDIERCTCMVGYSGSSTTLSYCRPIIVENCYIEGATLVDNTLYNNTQHQYNFISVSNSYVYYNFSAQQIEDNNNHLDSFGLYNHPIYLKLASFSDTTNQQISIHNCQLVGKNGTTCIQGSQVGIIFEENNSCGYVTADSSRFNCIRYNLSGTTDYAKRVNFNDGLKIGRSDGNLNASIGVMRLKADGSLERMANGSYNQENPYIAGVIPTTFLTNNANGYPYHNINEELAFIFNRATHELLTIYDGKIWTCDGTQVYPTSQ